MKHAVGMFLAEAVGEVVSYAVPSTSSVSLSADTFPLRGRLRKWNNFPLTSIYGTGKGLSHAEKLQLIAFAHAVKTAMMAQDLHIGLGNAGAFPQIID